MPTKSIPDEFCSSKKAKPVAFTVEELITQLQRLPPSLPISAGCEAGVRLIVYDVNLPSITLEIQEIEDDDDNDSYYGDIDDYR